MSKPCNTALQNTRSGVWKSRVLPCRQEIEASPKKTCFWINPHVLYIFPRSVSLPSQFVQLLLNFFYFQSSIQIFICRSICHCNCLLCLTLLCKSFYYFYLLFYSMLSLLFLFFLFSLVLPHSNIMSPYLLFISKNVIPNTVSAVFLSISAVLTHSSGNPSSPPKILVAFSLNAL